ncbi:MAG: hypothetical protein WAW36_05855 [Methylovulum miyakonense]|uniref:hypothetical protein n=1 Tax=Methylovulum miyakonense TaxID=645578 RepID=UPI003BB77F12
MANLNPNLKYHSQPKWLNSPAHEWKTGTLDRQVLYECADLLQLTPNFHDACRGFAENMLDAYASNWLLNKIAREIPRFALMGFVMYLHHRRGLDGPGVTYTRIQELYALGSNQGILASPTRVKAMLGLAVVAGQLRRVESSDRRVKLLEPTEKMIGPALHWLESYLDAVGRAVPLIKSPQELAATPEILGELMTYIVYAYRHDRFGLSEAFPAIDYFLLRENGYVTLMEITRSMRFEQGEWYAQAPSVILSKNFSMARGTVRNLLAYSEKQGWLTNCARGGHKITLSSDFATSCQRWVSLEMVWMGGLINAAAVNLTRGPNRFSGRC